MFMSMNMSNKHHWVREGLATIRAALNTRTSPLLTVCFVKTAIGCTLWMGVRYMCNKILYSFEPHAALWTYFSGMCILHSHTKT